MEYLPELIKDLPVWPFIILSGLFTGLIVIYVNRRNTFRSASSDLVNAFSRELTVIRAETITEPGTTYDALLDAFDKHHQAVIEFERFLPFYKRYGFRKAWETYRKHSANFGPEWPDHENMNHLKEYLAINDEEETKAKTLALNRINKLLSYAKAI